MDTNRVSQAQRIVADARAALGHDLCGLSITDLLLDNMPDLRNVGEARLLIALANIDTTPHH